MVTNYDNVEYFAWSLLQFFHFLLKKVKRHKKARKFSVVSVPSHKKWINSSLFKYYISFDKVTNQHLIVNIPIAGDSIMWRLLGIVDSKVPPQNIQNAVNIADMYISICYHLHNSVNSIRILQHNVRGYAINGKSTTTYCFDGFYKIQELQDTMA